MFFFSQKELPGVAHKYPPVLTLSITHLTGTGPVLIAADHAQFGHLHWQYSVYFTYRSPILCLYIYNQTHGI